MKQILVEDSLLFNKVAILKDGELDDFLYEEKKGENLLGNIYKGRVENILIGMEAAFIDVGLKKNAYIHIDDLLSDKFLKEKNMKKKEVNSINSVLKKAEEILVQINREPIGEKNISVTTDISLSGKYIALIPKSREVNISKKIRNINERNRLLKIGKEIMVDGNGMIIRTFSAYIDKSFIENEYNLLLSLFNQIEKEYSYSYAPKLLYKSNNIIEKLFQDYVDIDTDEIHVEDDKTKEQIKKLIKNYNLSNQQHEIKIVDSGSNLFDKFNIEKQIDILFDRKVELENGGSIFIDVTEALTVIDVNSGKYIGNINIEQTALNLNLLALVEIKRQVKLRNISGIIIIDFIDLKTEENKQLLVEKAKVIFRDEKVKTTIVGMTKLNLMEITRKKNKENFFNLMTRDCECCNGTGKVNSTLQIIFKIENIVRRVKNNTSCECIVLSVGNTIYNNILKWCKDEVLKTEERYDIKIYFTKDEKISTQEITVDKMGKIDYIKDLNINMYDISQ